jgi:hypothetical protein
MPTRYWMKSFQVSRLSGRWSSCVSFGRGARSGGCVRSYSNRQARSWIGDAIFPWEHHLLRRR